MEIGIERCLGIGFTFAIPWVVSSCSRTNAEIPAVSREEVRQART